MLKSVKIDQKLQNQNLNQDIWNEFLKKVIKDDAKLKLLKFVVKSHKVL